MSMRVVVARERLTGCSKSHLLTRPPRRARRPLARQPSRIVQIPNKPPPHYSAAAQTLCSLFVAPCPPRGYASGSSLAAAWLTALVRILRDVLPVLYLGPVRAGVHTDFFSILLSSRVTSLMPRCPFVGECHGSIPFAKYFRNSVHQFGDLLDIFRGKILSKSRVQPPPSFHFFSGDGRHHAHQRDLGSCRTLRFRRRGEVWWCGLYGGRRRVRLSRPRRLEEDLRPG